MSLDGGCHIGTGSSSGDGLKGRHSGSSVTITPKRTGIFFVSARPISVYTKIKSIPLNDGNSNIQRSYATVCRPDLHGSSWWLISVQARMQRAGSTSWVPRVGDAGRSFLAPIFPCSIPQAFGFLYDRRAPGCAEYFVKLYLRDYQRR